MTNYTNTYRDRRHDFLAAGDHLGLHASQPLAAHRRRLQQSLQCARAPPVRRLAQ